MPSESIKVRLCSRQKGGHRRIGRFIPDQEHDLEVTPEQLKTLRADSMIFVVELPSTPEKSSK